LACHAARHEYYTWGDNPPWQSINVSHIRAWNEWQSWQDTPVADQFQVQYGEKDYLYSAFVVVWGKEVKCVDTRYGDY
jgi:hypothetical protein